MARSRNIKPGFFTNDALVELSFSTRLLFIGLWTLADRRGVLEDRPKKIKMAIFPADDVDVDAAISELESSGFIARYKDGKTNLIKVLQFEKHQNPHKNEQASTYPDYCEHGASTVQAQEQHCATPADSLLLIPDSGFLIPDTPAPAGKIKKPIRAPRSGDGLFSEFWSAYPNKVAKAAAEKAWNKINPDKPLFDEIMAGLDRARGSPSWTKDGGQFIPHPATWLNGMRWTDAPVTVIGRHDLRGMDYTKGVGEDGSF